MPGRRSVAVTFFLGLMLLLALSACSSAHLQPETPDTNPRLRTAPLSSFSSPSASSNWSYALVIDASSSASSLQIYQWRERPGRLPEIQTAPFPRADSTETWEIKVAPGLSAYAGRPVEAARSLEPLIAFALEKIGEDPEALARTSLSLRATAGMRLLSQSDRADILATITATFDELPFGRHSESVLSGAEEGVYGWIAVNYLLGHLDHGGPFPTVGALDLGGASTQITFVPLDYPREDAQAITLGSNTYHLYTRSYLGLGQDQARESIASPACFLEAYPLPDGSVGTGDLPACADQIRKALLVPCKAGPCSGFGAYQPPLYGSFLAFSVYAYAADFFGLDQRLVPADVAEKGAAFCAQNWTELVAADPELEENPYFPNYCYAAAHISVLLTDGFGFSPTTERITAPLRVQGKKVGWALGALVYDLAGVTD